MLKSRISIGGKVTTILSTIAVLSLLVISFINFSYCPRKEEQDFLIEVWDLGQYKNNLTFDELKLKLNDSPRVDMKIASQREIKIEFLKINNTFPYKILIKKYNTVFYVTGKMPFNFTYKSAIPYKSTYKQEYNKRKLFSINAISDLSDVLDMNINKNNIDFTISPGIFVFFEDPLFLLIEAIVVINTIGILIIVYKFENK